jgi:hypothetical protein
MRTLYSIEGIDMGESSRYEPMFTSKQLDTYGDNLGELLDNATYFYIDQDGGEVGQSAADDDAAHDYIKEWYRENQVPEMEFHYDKDPMELAKEYDIDTQDEK